MVTSSLKIIRKSEVNNMVGEKIIDTFSDYISDDTRVTSDERKLINSEIALIGKVIEVREQN